MLPLELAWGKVRNVSTTELERAVEQLPPEELAAFANWFEEYLADRWDEQMERDILAGRLDHLGEKAVRAFESGECTPL